MYIYLSHHERDQEIAQHIRDTLRLERFSVWVNHALMSGRPITSTETANAIAEAQGIIAILSPHHQMSVELDRDIRLATEHNIPIFPVLVAGDAQRVVPPSLANHPIIDVRADAADHEGYNQLISLLKRHASQMAQLKHIFISYSRRDSKTMRRLQRDVQRARFPIWVDEQNLRAGKTKNWQQALYDAIEAAGCVLLLMSPDSCVSEWVGNEIAHAEANDIPVVPVLIRGDMETSVPERLELHQHIDLREAVYKPNLAELFASLTEFVVQASEEDFDIFDYLSVPYMLPEFVFNGNKALDQNDLRCTYQDEMVALPPELESIRLVYLEEKRSQARKHGITLDNNQSYSLQSLSVSREQNTRGFRHNIYTLNLCPTDYFHFIFPNLALDEDIDIDGHATTPRQHLNLSHRIVRFENLTHFPIHHKVGTGTIFITQDNQVVISIRSNLQFVVGGTSYHLSAAEGMLRPVDEVDGVPSPFLTVARALEDELGLQADVDYKVEDIRCIGITLDTLRAQPFCMFYVESKAITFKQLKQKWLLDAIDRHENRDIIGRGWNEHIANDLIDEQLTYNGEQIGPSSNHAQIGYKLAALHKFGTGFFEV